MFWYVVIGVSFLKLLLIPYYTSTDFEVHRNWLAITHSLPINQWYTENTSQWTLDYPPMFAWFEYAMSQVAKFVDPKMLEVDNLEYKSYETICFQRATVVVTDLVLVFGIWTCSSALSRSRSKSNIRDEMAVLILTNAGLLFVDHIHFQYNGILIGILLTSIGFMLQGRFILSGLVFAALLNMKHIFLYGSPPYFVYLLTTYCYPRTQSKIWEKATNLILLGIAVLFAFGVSLFPFIGQLPHLLSRLFPFKRGLTHAYWAPNFWAIYSALDRVLGLVFGVKGSESPTSGLVQESSFVILPAVSPITTFVLTLTSMIPILMTLWRQPSQGQGFLRSLVLCTFSSFMFGWHVHEKAILLVTIPAVILMAANPGSSESRFHFLLTAVGNFSLFPLLFRVQEILVKFALWCFHFAVCLYFKDKIPVNWRRKDGLKWFEKLYLFGIPFVFAFPALSDATHPLILQKYEFLPLMLYSLYCSVGTVYCYVNLYLSYVLS